MAAQTHPSQICACCMRICTKANASDWDSGTRRLRNSERDFKYSVSHSQSPSGRLIFHVREVNELVHLLKV